MSINFLLRYIPRKLNLSGIFIFKRNHMRIVYGKALTLGQNSMKQISTRVLQQDTKLILPIKKCVPLISEAIPVLTATSLYLRSLPSTTKENINNGLNRHKNNAGPSSKTPKLRLEDDNISKTDFENLQHYIYEFVTVAISENGEILKEVERSIPFEHLASYHSLIRDWSIVKLGIDPAAFLESSGSPASTVDQLFYGINVKSFNAMNFTTPKGLQMKLLHNTGEEASFFLKLTPKTPDYIVSIKNLATGKYCYYAGDGMTIFPDQLLPDRIPKVVAQMVGKFKKYDDLSFDGFGSYVFLDMRNFSYEELLAARDLLFSLLPEQYHEHLILLHSAIEIRAYTAPEVKDLLSEIVTEVTAGVDPALLSLSIKDKAAIVRTQEQIDDTTVGDNSVTFKKLIDKYNAIFLENTSKYVREGIREALHDPSQSVDSQIYEFSMKNALADQQNKKGLDYTKINNDRLNIKNYAKDKQREYIDKQENDVFEQQKNEQQRIAKKNMQEKQAQAKAQKQKNYNEMKSKRADAGERRINESKNKMNKSNDDNFHKKNDKNYDDSSNSF